jgi:hypothetical protein
LASQAAAGVKEIPTWLVVVSWCELLLGCAAATTATGNRLLWTFSRARIGARSLSTDREIPAVAETTITADFDQPLDIHLDFATQIAFYLIILGNILA